MEARGGGVSSIRVFSGIFAKVDPAAAAKFNALWTAGSTEYRKVMKPKREQLEKDLGRAKSPSAKKIIKAAYDEDRGIESGLCVTNPAFEFIIKWLEANKQKTKTGKVKNIVCPSDSFVQELYRYVASMSPNSSKFIIMK
jgi:hypothetical protein